MDVRRGLRSTCLVWSAALLCACGGDEEVFDLRDASYPEDRPSDGGDAGDAGRRDASAGGMDASSDAGDAGDGSIDIDAATDIDANLTDASGNGADAGDAGPTAPEVAVLSPVGSLDPADGLVITGSTVAVQCAANGRQGRGIASVTIAIFDQTDATIPKVQVPGVYGGDGGYANTMVSLANVSTGPIRIRCTAIDDISDPEVGWDEVETLYDGGPIVTFDNPTDGKIVARGGNSDTVDLNIRFRVAPTSLTASLADAGMAPDPDADIDTVSLVINDLPWQQPLVLTNGVYSADLDFWTFFNHTPVDRASFEVVATNHRGVTVKKKINVQVDGVGPTVTVTKPARVGDSPPFVGGITEVRASASDMLAGFGSARALIQTPSGIREYMMPELTPGIIGFDFDANSFTERAQLVAQIQVFDKVGNKTEASLTMIVDTVGPWVSLDPPNIRTESSSTHKCTGSFDPLGFTPIDGQVIAQQARFRAMVYERATQIAGATEYFYSGVNGESVDLVAQPYGAALDPASGRQLLVDRDGDGICDIVDDSPVTTGQLTPFRVRMKAVSTGGTAPDAEDPMNFSEDPVPTLECSGGPNITGSMILPKCTGNDMTFVLGHPSDGSSVVYGVEPGGGILCTGTSVDFGGPGGWYCVTTVARDKSGSEGNLSIAEPLRVCRWLKAGDCGVATPGMLLMPPAGLTCTDGCTLPSVWTTPAMPRIVAQ